MALGVCHADGALNEPEKEFLTELCQALQLASSELKEHEQAVTIQIEAPLTLIRC
jgi:tellurite resistance protein